MNINSGTHKNGRKLGHLSVFMIYSGLFFEAGSGNTTIV